MAKPIYVRLKGEMARKFFQIKRYLGLENDTEVLRSLIGWYYREHQDSLPPSMEHINTWEDHITVKDHFLNRLIDIYPKPEGRLWCEHCDDSHCAHVTFALKVSEVQKALEKRGWSWGE